MTGMELFTIPALSAAGEATAVTLGDALMATTMLGTTVMSAGSQMAQADANNKIAAANAKSAENAAKQERAAAQRNASEERRRAAIASSNLQAAAAASGAGASDAGVIDLEEDIAEEGEYRALMQIYQGEQSARNNLSQASSIRYKAQSESDQLPYKIGSTIMDFGTKSLNSYAEYKYPKYKLVDASTYGGKVGG